jgi:phage terminase Nu1 subunit (DNA packaging protein)
MNARTNAGGDVLNEAQAALYLNVSPRTLQDWRCKGLGPIFCRMGARSVRYRRADLDSFIARGAAQSTTEADARKRAG